MEILNKYVYDPQTDLIGKGGFATVYKAYDKLLDIPVALKFFHPQDQASKYTIINEIRRAITLAHPNIVRYFGVETITSRNFHGEEEQVQVGVMELVQEGQMKKFLDQNPVSRDELCKLFKDILEGLKYLHAQGIIHRDIKPQNILLGRDKNNRLIAKIADFGISKTMDSNQNSASLLLGTIEYMAPEQFNPEKYGIDKRISYNVDIWAFGVTAYYLITGKLLFGSRSGDTSAAQIINRIVNLEGLQSNLGKVPEPFRSLLERCIVPDAKARTGDVDELIAVLAAAQDKAGPMPIKAASHAQADEETIIIPAGASVGAGFGAGDSDMETAVLDAPMADLETAVIDPAVHLATAQGDMPQDTGTATAEVTRKKKPVLLFSMAAIVLLAAGYYFIAGPGGAKEKQLTKQELAKLAADSLENQMVSIAGGNFSFGGAAATDVPEEALNPEQQMVIRTFKMLKTEVTRGQWNDIMQDNKYKDALKDTNNRKLPANNVSWDEARQFTLKLGVLTGKQYRLPTQIEWEYASMQEYPAPRNLNNISWNVTNAGKKVHPVAQKQAGKSGTYDLFGNVFEWCEELVDLELEGGKVQARVIRGGDFENDLFMLDPKVRNVDLPTAKKEIIGFRVVLDAQ